MQKYVVRFDVPVHHGRVAAVGVTQPGAHLARDLTDGRGCERDRHLADDRSKRPPLEQLHQ
jgi:hypothetical protein